jgi:hypothetical protein
MFTHSSVFACSCGEISPQDAFAGAREVFAGTVLHIARFEPASPSALPAVSPMETGEGAVEPPPVQIIENGPMNRVTFQVTETWKGSNTIVKAVVTGQGNGDCGVPFVLGTDYLVYSGDTGSLADAPSVHACGGTSLHFLAGAHLGFLGAGEKPIHPVLNIVQDQNSVMLSWRTNWTNFRLEAARSFQAPTLWEPVTNLVAIVDANYVVTSEIAYPGALFRLAR